MILLFLGLGGFALTSLALWSLRHYDYKLEAMSNKRCFLHCNLLMFLGLGLPSSRKVRKYEECSSLCFVYIKLLTLQASINQRFPR